jgi:toxin YoeB
VFGQGRLVSWQILFTKQAQQDAKKLSRSNLRAKAEASLALIARDPFQTPPPYEKLVGDLTGAYSRRLNIQHRIVYQVYRRERVVKILRMWTHYE